MFNEILLAVASTALYFAVGFVIAKGVAFEDVKTEGALADKRRTVVIAWPFLITAIIATVGLMIIHAITTFLFGKTKNDTPISFHEEK